MYTGQEQTNFADKDLPELSENQIYVGIYSCNWLIVRNCTVHFMLEVLKLVPNQWNEAILKDFTLIELG
uniref:Uncharacterized protein n=1 Tax=Rhizophora mucronata TaxID=61149 RepID=A0A2P2PZD2_RHIMU